MTTPTAGAGGINRRKRAPWKLRVRALALAAFSVGGFAIASIAADRASAGNVSKTEQLSVSVGGNTVTTFPETAAPWTQLSALTVELGCSNATAATDVSVEVGIVRPNANVTNNVPAARIQGPTLIGGAVLSSIKQYELDGVSSNGLQFAITNNIASARTCSLFVYGQRTATDASDLIKLDAAGSTGTLATHDASPSTQAVTGTFWPTTQPISGSVGITGQPIQTTGAGAGGTSAGACRNATDTAWVPCPVVIDSSGNVVAFTADALQRIDLGWYSGWMICGLLVALLLLPYWRRAWAWFGA